MSSPTSARTAPTMFWFIPTHGDGAYLGSHERQRPPEFRYFREIATAVDRLGFKGVLLPTGQSCEDSWIVATGLAVATERLKFLVALRPGVTSPAFAARQTAALDRVSEGRLLLNVVVGGDAAELAGDGVFTPHDERYAQAAEYLEIWRRLVQGETVDFEGRYYRVEHGRLDFSPVQQPRPPLWFGGSSEPGQDLAAEQLDTYLTWGEPPAAPPWRGAGGSCSSGCASTSSCGKPRTRPGRRRTGFSPASPTPRSNRPRSASPPWIRSGSSA